MAEYVDKPVTLSLEDIHKTKQYWLNGTEGIGLQDLDKVAMDIAKILKETPNILAVKVDVRFGVEITEVYEETDGKD